jgi:hypothetical protein
MTKSVGGEGIELDWSADSGFMTRERLPFSGGFSGVECADEDQEAEAGPSCIVTTPELTHIHVDEFESKDRKEGR